MAEAIQPNEILVRIPSRLEMLDVIDRVAAAIAEYMEFPEEEANSVSNSVIEAGTNAIQHGHFLEADLPVDFVFRIGEDALRIAVRDKIFDDTTAPDFSKTFIRWVEEFGRSFELGLMGVHMIRHNPFGAFKILDMGVGMVTKGRMAFTPTRIKGMDGLKRILAKAKALEAQA